VRHHFSSIFADAPDTHPSIETFPDEIAKRAQGTESVPGMLWLNFGQLVALLVFLGWAIYLVTRIGDWEQSARGWQLFGLIIILGGAMILIIGGFSASQLAVFLDSSVLRSDTFSANFST
jgi:hypothetical protein